MGTRMWLLIVAAGTNVTLSAQAPKPSFAIASVRPVTELRVFPTPVGFPGGRFYRSGDTVAGLITFAYDVMPFQVIGPRWIREDPFEVDARAAGEASGQQIRLMLQSLLEERFGLVVRREQRAMEHSILVVAREDGRLGSGLAKCQWPKYPPAPKRIRVPPGGVPLAGTCLPASSIADSVAYSMQAPIVDGTGLAGLWNYQLVFSPSPPRTPSGDAAPLPASDQAPPLPIALEEQLGLKLKTSRDPVDVLVIEAVRQPTEN
jgi:uncharacterized protein (TIGR03435 family)